MIISTKEKIKKAALSLFAQKGYHGTSMSDLAEAVGITKASLYAHFSGKEDLFSAIFADTVLEHEKLTAGLAEESKDMEVQKRLRYNFEQYIIYFYRNPLVFLFWHQTLNFVPPELREKLYHSSDWADYRKTLADAFAEGMEQGIIRKGDTEKMVLSFIAMRDGAHGWMRIRQDLKEECIEDFWHVFWFGVTNGGGAE